MNRWKDTRLGDLVEIKHGWPFVGEQCTEELTGRPIVVSIGNFRYTGGFRFEETTTREYRGEYPSEYELTPGDILLVMTCQTAGGEILVKDSTAIDADYLYWLFLSPEFNRELFVSATGSKILHTAPKRIEAFRFHCPSLPEQKAIAAVLGALDDKIELNRRMNATLEAMARALFQSWFVDFDPVRAKAEGRPPAGLDERHRRPLPRPIPRLRTRRNPAGLGSAQPRPDRQLS